FHLPQPDWLHSSDSALWSIIIVTVWKNSGWAMLFYSDALQKIPQDLYEVSSIEGSSWWQRMRTIVIPLVSPTTLFLSIMLAIESIQAYDQIQVMTQGGPSGSTRTLLYMYYQMAFEQFNMGQATAISTIIVVITGILALTMFYASTRWVHYYWGDNVLQKNLITKRTRFGYYVFLLVLSVLMVFALIWMLLSALTSPEEILAIPVKWFPEVPQRANFKQALELAPV